MWGGFLIGGVLPEAPVPVAFEGCLCGRTFERMGGARGTRHALQRSGLVEDYPMKRYLLFALGMCLLGVLALSPAWAADHAFVGADKCKMCHNAAPKGAQYTKWSESAHAKAFAALGSEEAKKVASAKGIADPQKAPECLKCHVTGHGVDAARLTDKYNAAQGVSCESCHGAGGDYWKMEVMKDEAKATAAGMVLPKEDTCKTCHNAESPTFKGFDFATYAAKIAHPNPQSAAK